MKSKPNQSPQSKLREALKSRFDAYKWTVHQPIVKGASIIATGIITSGFNRVSTLQVVMRDGGGWFEISIFGYGTRSERLYQACGITLPQAHRDLFEGLKRMAAIYKSQSENILLEAKS